MITEKEFLNWRNELDLFKAPLLWEYTMGASLSIRNQIHYNLTMCIRGVSCLLMKNRIMIRTRDNVFDPRVSLIYFSGSSTGKGKGNSYYYDVFNAIGLRIKTLKKPTIEKVVGSFDTETDKKNKQKGWNPGDDKYISPIIPGYLETEDDIIFDEAQMLFEPRKTEHSNQIMRYARVALDNYGSPTNLLESETLKNRGGHNYHCACNIGFLSTHVDKIEEEIITNGIFQRVINFFYHIPKADMMNILSPPKVDIYELIKTRKQKAINFAKEVQTYVQTISGTQITAQDESHDLINNYIKEYFEHAYTQGEEFGELVQSFLPRLKENIYKVGASLAVMKKRNVITPTDVEEAIKLVVDVSFQSLKDTLLKNTIMMREARRFNDLQKAIKRGKNYTKTEIDQRMAMTWGVSERTARLRLKPFESLFRVTKGEKGNLRYYSLK